MVGFWEKITGSDIDKAMKAFDLRVKELPGDYQLAWENITSTLWQYSDFSGRNLLPILDNLLSLFEETVADNLSVQEVLGSDIKGFCLALAGSAGAKNYRDKWRQQLNDEVRKKLAT